MANIHTLVATVNDLYYCCHNSNKFHCYDDIASLTRRKNYLTKKKCRNSSNRNVTGPRVSVIGYSWRLRAATELRFVEESTSRSSNTQNQVPFIEIPVTCYQILGVHDQAEKDEIVKSVKHLKNAEVEEGYTKDAVISRHNILMDVRDKLLFEPEYSGIVKEKQPPKSSIKIPWAWLPGALCLLQEAGEEKLVLEIGRRALQHPDSKPFVHDMLLAMALAECAIAKVGFEKNNISQGFEALARAQCLLRSKISLGKMMLLSQINKAKLICECLIASEGIDLKFEEAFCSFLLGQGDEAIAVERLRQLEVNSNPSSQKSLQMKEIREVSSADKPLETWLKEAALCVFPDTRDCSPSLADFFTCEKRNSGNRHNKRTPPAVSNIRHRPIAAAFPSYQKNEEPISPTESSRHLGSAVKQLAPPNLQSQVIEGKAIGVSNGSPPSTQLKRSLGAKPGEVWKFWLGLSHVVGKIIWATALGCILVAVLKLKSSLFWRMGSGSRWKVDKRRIETSSPTSSADSFMDLSYQSATFKKNGIARKFKKFLSILKLQSGDLSEAADLQTASLSAGLSSPMKSTYRQQMSVEDAEILVKRWQAIKAEALGPDHDVHGLFEVLDGSMLVQWQGLADAAKARSCFWRFILLQLKVVRADILKDGIGREMAEIEVFLEEAAELVDESQPKNPTYYSPYKILYLLKRQDDGSWRFCEGDILTTS